jgi:predicted O-methyltransferase YrrM
MKALELGLDYGYSSIRIARLLPEKARLISICVNSRMVRVAKESVYFAGLDNKVE